MPDPSLTPDQIAPLADILAVANTPAYLFKHYYNDANVQSLSRQSSASDLLSHARQITTAASLTLDQSVLVYANIVAAIQRPFKEVATAIADTSVIPQIRWANEILNMRHSAQTSNSSFTVIATTPSVITTSASGSRRVDTTTPSFQVYGTRGKS
jgi:hypothetical protein